MQQGIQDHVPGIVVPPSVLVEGAAFPHRTPIWENEVRRVGLCGSLRASSEQWRDFLGLLGSLPFRFEIISYCSDTPIRDEKTPPNVSVQERPYAGSEEEVIRAFNNGYVDACYLGLWREPGETLFGRTSLSSKIVTYSAAGVPIIVDAAPDSVAWRLVREYGAGVLCNGNTTSDRQALERLFGDATVWRQMAEGSHNLCVKEFNLEKNVGRLKEVLERTARKQSVPLTGAGKPGGGREHDNIWSSP
jgi:glycosyltransferase involved in cell wall biosynthesis